MENLGKELSALLNRHSTENNSGTPDFILAVYLLNCLQNFEQTVIRREHWYGRDVTENIINIDPKYLESDKAQTQEVTDKAPRRRKRW